MAGQISNQSKTDQKGKAITSLIFGIVGLSLSIIFTYFIPSVISIIIHFGAFLIALVGLVFGVSGLQSTKKKQAILGIILCIVTLIFILRIAEFL